MTRRRTPEAAAERRELRAALTDPGPVMEAAAAFLAVRPRSVAETTRRMVRLGYPPALVDQVVSRLQEMGYLDDVDFARAWIESRDRAHPRGAGGLRRELALKGVAPETVAELLDERADKTPGEDPDRAAAVALLGRRQATLDREPDPRKRRQKAYALLARNGFDPETCRDVANELFLRG